MYPDALRLANDLAAATQVSFDSPHTVSEECLGALIEVDFADPVDLHAAIRRVHPFGDIIRFDGIVEACANNRGQELLKLLTPLQAPAFEEVAITEIMPTVDWIASITCLQTRAEMICRTQFFGTCPVSRALIAEVADAGPLGVLAQAYLQPPAKLRSRRGVGNRAQTRRRKRA
jgi:hypothetical protein